jgi:nucleoid-associated protein YgaU
MTRETKIGLLVGLAFIIVIGILLSDQLMRSTEPPPAPLAGAADTVRRATATPASNQPAPVARTGPVAEVTPENTVPVREEVIARPPPVTFVEIRPGNGGQTVIVPSGQGANTQGTNVALGQPPVAGQNQLIGENPGPVSANPRAVNGGANGGTGQVFPVSVRGRGLADEAAAVGETLIGPDGQALRASQPLRPPAVGNGGQNPRPAPLAMKQYKAEIGDNLSRLASKFFGSNTKAARDAILAANPSLAGDPNKIIIGQVYNIPVPAAAEPGTVQITRSGQTGPAGTPPTRGGNSPQPPAPSNVTIEHWYTVKSGDNLWKIAVEQCGDKNMVAAIKELNRETVKDWDRLQANMKIRLPVKPAGATARADR